MNDRATILRFFHPVLRSRSLGKTPVPVRVNDLPLVAFRDQRGAAAILSDECAHRRAPLSRGRVLPDGRLACPYHGWNYDRDGHGRSPGQPSLRRCDIAAFRVEERHGLIWVAERDAEPSSAPELQWPGFELAGDLCFRIQAPLDVTLDNISEDEHFSFVHTTFGWDTESLPSVKVTTRKFLDRSEVEYIGPQRRSPWARLGGVRPGDTFHNAWVTRFDPVHTLYTFGWRDADTGEPRPITTKAAVFLVPESDQWTRLFMLIFMRVARPPQRWFRPVMHALSKWIARMELRRDVTLIEAVAGAQRSLDGMRLTRFDEALIHNRKLLEHLYYQRPAAGGLRRLG